MSFLLKASRPGFWLTQIWFFLLPLSQLRLFDSPRFWLGIVYVSFGLGVILYGWNDLVDAETDRENPRKDTFLFGARGTKAQLARLPWWIVAVQAPFVVAFVWLDGPRMLIWFAALILTTYLYNHFPPAGLKSRPPFELLNQVGYLLVFVLACWLNGVQLPAWPLFVFGALFAMHSHLFGEIMDLAPDRAAGRTTTASMLGAQRAKLLVSAFLAGEAALVLGAFRSPMIATGLGAAAGWFVVDALVLWRDRGYTTREMRCFFLGWNAVALATMWWIWRTGALSVPA